MSRNTASLVLAVAGIIGAALGWGVVALFILFAAFVTYVLGLEDEDHRDARRRNRR